MKRLVYLLSLGVFLSACGEGSIRSIDSDPFFAQDNPFQPLITIQGENPVTIERATAWTDPGVFAQSYREGNLNNRIQVSSNVNFNKIGSYQIVYSVSDSQGRSTSATRQVIVDDTILPSVSINDSGLGGSPSFDKNTPRSILISDSSQDAIRYQAVVVAGSNSCASADFANAPQKNISEPFVLNPNVGSNKVCVRGIDEAGNIQASPTASRVLAIENPSLTISLNRISPTNETSVNVTANGVGIDFFKVIRTDSMNCIGANFSEATETPIQQAAAFNGLSEGDHFFCAIGRNQNGDYELTQVATQTLEVDNTPPTISISGPSQALVNQSDQVTYTVTYADANDITINLAPDHVQLNPSGVNCSSVTVSSGGNPRTVTLSGCTGDGTVGITIAEGSAVDAAGNPAPASTPSATFTVDNTPPTIMILNEVRSANFDHSLTLCQSADFSPSANDSSGVSSENFPTSFDFSKTGSTNYDFSATDAAGNIRTITMALNISLPAAYSHYGNATFHRVQDWAHLSGQDIANKNLFLCDHLSFEIDDTFTSIANYNSILEGNQKTISGLDTNLFEIIGSNAEIRNLVLKNLTVELTSENAGGLASTNLGLIEQVGIRGADLSIICDDCGESFFGGLVGTNSGEIIDSYFEGEMRQPTDQTAGLVGDNSGTIETSYSSAANEFQEALGLVGPDSSMGVVTNSYWNCGADECEDNSDPDRYGTALNLNEMEDSGSFDGFDFEMIWKMLGNSNYLYPVFQFE